MTKSVLLALVLFCIAAGACAQQVRPRAEHANKQDDPQQRRAAVRAALALRDQKGEEPPKPRRQLTAQERQELRQQLRQQRNDSAKP